MCFSLLFLFVIFLQVPVVSTWEEIMVSSHGTNVHKGEVLGTDSKD